ncbi:MAG: TetR/AcrR family transcriptional regulator C-terminal domain-containing protein, partial [Candidatus Eisenbacteria bacterium]
MPLSPERIVERALLLIERDGLEGWSLRTLAGALRCEAMSLYHHFPSKGHILDAAADRVVGTLAFERRSSEAWDAAFGRFALEYYDLARRYPRAFPLLATRRANGPNLYRMVETLLSLLVEGGFSPAEAARIFRVVGAFLNGAGLTHIAVTQQQPDATPVELERRVDAERYPTLAAAATY